MRKNDNGNSGTMILNALIKKTFDFVLFYESEGKFFVVVPHDSLRISEWRWKKAKKTFNGKPHVIHTNGKRFLIFVEEGLARDAFENIGEELKVPCYTLGEFKKVSHMEKAFCNLRP